MTKKSTFKFKWFLLVLLLFLTSCGTEGSTSTSKEEEIPYEEHDFNVPEDMDPEKDQQGKTEPNDSKITLSDIPSYAGKDYVILNGNTPNFETEELTTESYEYYGSLDALGRCTVVQACIGQDLMPTEERGSIGQVKPTGWHTVKYDHVDGKYLYNRCHLIGFQLSGENANEKNLITGTRQMNVDGMLPFENMVADYVKETGNHVMYRVTPLFEGDNLLAAGVQMEAYSVEDEGDGICFHVFVYNVQDGVEIDYATGESKLAAKEETDVSSDSGKYAVNGKNGKIHIVGGCSATEDGDRAMENPVYFDTYEEALEYSKELDGDLENRDCGNCW